MLLTPVQRHTFDASGKITDSHGDYDDAACRAEAGFVEHARDRTMRGVRLTTAKGEPLKLTNAAGVESPEVVRK